MSDQLSDNERIANPEIFIIEGKKYIRSTEPLRDNDEVYFIYKGNDAKIPFGTKGFIESVWYDRVNYLGNEYVIWLNQTAKLIDWHESQETNKV